MKANNILETIGKTPHVKLERLYPGKNVWIKLERNNPGNSIKDRIALAMIEDAEKKGILNPDGTPGAAHIAGSWSGQPSLRADWFAAY